MEIKFIFMNKLIKIHTTNFIKYRTQNTQQLITISRINELTCN